MLAFEDNTDIYKLLIDADIVYGEFKQQWTTECVRSQGGKFTAST